MIRVMQIEDLNEVHALILQLGYTASPAEVQERWYRLHRLKEQALYVSQNETKENSHFLGGFIHVHVQHSLLSEPHAEIAALIVAENRRRLGIGKALVHQAETWAKDAGFTKIKVGSRIERPEAHYFYQQMGYVVEKTHKRYVKPLKKMDPIA